MAEDGENGQLPAAFSLNPTPMKFTNITLEPVEALLKKLLLSCRNHMARSSSQWSKPASQLELRFTGGWVRDKLLGIGSHDIDIALSSMTGAQFGKMLEEYVTAYGTEFEEEAKSVNVDNSLSAIHEIKANPEQSKHLETATTRIFGLEVDFVNLRKETYTTDSRNPQVEFGTAKEDADRRDATINALFYNLDKDAVEDFTGSGLQDLRSGIIRTPLPPFETFMDDPLRILRLVRFASKYGYSLMPESEHCMANPKIHEALLHKITRDRVGVELEKMFKGKDTPYISRSKVLTHIGPNPHRALSTIYDAGLLEVVFQGTVSDRAPPGMATIPDVYKALHEFQASPDDLVYQVLLSGEETHYPWYLASYLPWYFPSQDRQANRVNKFKDAIRASNKVMDRITNAIRYRSEVLSTAHQSMNLITRNEVGMKLKQWGSTWRTTVLFAILNEIQLDPSNNAALEKYRKLMAFIKEHELESADKARPIIDGHAIIKHFGLKKGGPWLGKASNVVLEWQFRYSVIPENVDAVYSILEEKRSELGIPDPDPKTFNYHPM